VLAEHADGRIELIDGLAELAARDAAKAIRDGSGDDATEDAADDAEESDPWLIEPPIAFNAEAALRRAAM
jgi:hypothetical protein